MEIKTGSVIKILSNLFFVNDVIKIDDLLTILMIEDQDGNHHDFKLNMSRIDFLHNIKIDFNYNKTEE